MLTAREDTVWRGEVFRAKRSRLFQLRVCGSF